MRRAGDLLRQGTRLLRPLVRGPPQAPPARRPGCSVRCRFSVRQFFFWSGCRAIPRRAAAFHTEVDSRIYQTALAFLPLLHQHHHQHHHHQHQRRPDRLGASAPPPGARCLLSRGCAWPARALLVVLGLPRLPARQAIRLAWLWPTPNRRHVDGGDPFRQKWGVGHVYAVGPLGRRPMAEAVLFPSGHDFSLWVFAFR